MRVVVAAFQPKIVPGRSCGTCNLCCKLPEIREVESPRSVLCKHWSVKTRCSIYACRPAVCRDFFCNWLLIETLGPEWQPERSRIMLQSVAHPDGHQGLSAHVDPDFPDNWLLPPYYPQLKRWAVKAQQHTKAIGPIYFVLAVIHRRNFLILPDHDIDLGDFEGRDQVEIERRVSNGRIEVLARKKGDPSRRFGEKISAFVLPA
jgi:uncharacterized protein